MGSKYWWRDEEDTEEKKSKEKQQSTSNKYWWRDEADTGNEQSGQQSSKDKYWWRDEDYYSYRSNQVGRDVSNRVNTWLENHNSYISDYQNRYSGRKGNYEDAYVSDAGSWLDTVKQRKAEYDAEADSILQYIEQNKSLLDKDWIKKVTDTITGARSQQGSIVDIATQDNDWWSNFAPNEEQAAAGYTAEQIYNAWQADRKQYDADLAFDVDAGLLELENLKKQREDYRVEQNEKAEQARKNETWWETLGRWLGNTPDTSLPLGGASSTSSGGIDYSEYDNRISELEKQIERSKYVQGYEGYMDYTKAEDYAANSQYVSKRTEVPLDDAIFYVSYGNSGLHPAYDTGKLFGDYNYDYINRNEDALAVANVNNTSMNKTILGLDEEFLQTMKDDEIGVYNYLYNTQGPEAANEFLSFVNSELLERKRILDQAFWAEQAKNDPFGTSFVSIVTSPLKAVTAVGQLADYLDDGKVDQNAGYNRNSYISSAIRDQVANDIAKSGKWGKVGSWTYQLGMSMGDFLLNTAISGGSSALSLGLMGSGAMADTVISAKDRGLSDDQAMILGVVAGGAEIITEKFSLDALFKGDMSKGAMRYILTNAFTEGTEEVGSSLINTFADILVSKDKSEWNMAIQEYLEEHPDATEGEAFGKVLVDHALALGLDFLGGALMGGTMGGGGAAVNYVTNASPNLQVNKDAVNQYGEFTNELIAEGLASPVESESYDLAKYYEKKTSKGKSMTGYEIRQLVDANEKQIAKENFADTKVEAERMLRELGETGDISKIAEVVAKRATGQELTRAEIKTLTNSYGSQVAKKLRQSEYAKQFEYKSLENRVSTDAKTSVSKTGQATIHETDTAIDLSKPEIVDFVRDKNGNVTDMVLNVDGKEVKASEIDFANEDQSYLFSAVSNIENITPADAQVIVRDYDIASGLTVGEYLNGIDEAYTYGYHNYSVEDMKAGNFTTKLSDVQMMSAYELGKAARKSNIDSKEANYKRMRTAVEAEAEQATAQKKAQFESKDVEVYFEDGGTVTKFDESVKYDDKRMAGVEYAKFLSKLGIGSKYYFYKSYVKDGVRVYKDADGNEVEAPNGIYRESDGSIHIDLNAGNEGQGTTLFTLGHELTHFIKQWSEAKFKVLADFLIEEYGKTNMSMHERVLAKQSELSNSRGKAVSYDEAFEEVVADSMSTMLTDGNLHEKLAKLKAKDKGLFNKIKQFFDKLIAKFRGIYAELTPEQRDARAVREMKDAFDKIQTAFAEALVEASENFQAAKAEKNTTEDGGVKKEAAQKRSDRIVDQIRKHLAEIMALDSVYTIDDSNATAYTSNWKTDEKRAQAVFKSQGSAANRPGFGRVILGKKGAVQTIHHGNGPAKQAVFPAIKAVIEQGIEIGRDYNHNGQGFDTVSFSAPVDFFAKKSPLAVVVKTFESVNADKTFYIHEICDSEGNYIKLAEEDSNKKISSTNLVDPSSTVSATDMGISPKTNVSQPEAEVKSESAVKKSDRDSNGNQLSKEQQEYFKDSKAVDENGNLKVVYHGTRNADFTVFKRNATYFTDNKEMADSYSPNGDMYEGYVNITKPYEIDAKGEKWSRIPIDDATKKFLQEYGSSVFKEDGKWRTSPADIVAAIEEAVDNGDMDYDGIIIKNVDDTGSYYKDKDSHLATDYITFDSNQFKNANNKKPTSNPDIRYSERNNATYAEIQEERQKLYQRERDITERKREAENNPELLQAMDDYSSLFSEVRGLFSKRHAGTATQAELDRIEEIKTLREERLNRIKDLQESLGLNELAKEAEEIRSKKEKLRVASDEAWAREGTEKENKAIEKAGVSAQEYFRNKALKTFKTTTNFNEAGYMLPDGKLLNFSGGERNHRYRDHREIGEIYEATNGTAALNRFLSDGNIRIMAESPGIDITTGIEPTVEQYAAIKRFINANGVKDGQFFVDFSDVDGHRAGNYSYEGRVNADRVVNDIKYFYENGKVREQSSVTQFHWSERNTDSVSNRSLLANAFEGITKSSAEYKLIQDYKGHIRLLNEYEEKLSKINAQIREIRFTEGKYDAKKLAQLEAEAKNTTKEINRHDRKLLSLEASEPLRKLIEQERKKEAEKTKAHVKEIQQNKKVRAEQAEYRHKIRKAIRDLDKILNRGNKKTNVKEDMKGFASKALELADYLFTDHISNDELIRRGIDPDIAEGAGKTHLVKETEDILSQLYDHADSLTNEEFTRLDAKRKANEDKLRDVLKAQRNRSLSTPVYKLFNDIVTEYAKLKNSNQDAIKAAYNPEIERFLRSYIGEENGQTDTDRKTLLENMRVADMTTDELWKLHNAYKMILHSIRTANELFVKGKLESIEKTVEQITWDFSKRKAPEGTVATVARNLANKMGWDYEKLYYALDRIGSEAFTELVMNIANSENIVMQDVMEAALFRDQMVEKYGYNNWDVNKKIDREFLDNTGKKFNLTLGELMALYAYSRREGALTNLEYGGFVFGKAALTNPKPADSYKLNKEQCEAITSLLTAEQKGYAEDMQKYLSEVMGEKGNEVSMLMYGIKMFTEKNYFPVHIAGQFKAQAEESKAKAEAGFTSMSNAGFTHAKNPNAKAPIVLEGFNEVWADHVNEMSRYHGTVPALEDMRRVMNRSSYSDANADSMAIKQLMENSYGKEAVEYFNNLYREANSGAITDKLQEKSKKLLSLFRKNSVAYSMSVIIQQPASLVRAYAMIDRKYFGFHGFGTLTSGIAKAVSSKWNSAYSDAYNEMLKYAPGVTMAKEIGGFDTATGGSIRSYLLDTNKSTKQKWKTGTALEKGKAVMDLVDDNAIANLPNVADKIAWIEIWNACKRETVAKHKDLAPNSAEFMQAVGDRFTEVIRATQVYDSIFAKSPMLKSKYLAVQYLVSFMNEPNTVANMAESAVRAATRGDWKKGAKTAAVVLHSIIFTNVLKSIIYAMRDDDEDETYIEKYLEAITGGMMDDFNPLNYIPVARDVWSVAQGYDVERADMAIVSDAIGALNNVIKNAKKDTEDMTEEELAEFDKKVTEANWNLVESLAAFFGIPVKNVRREINGVIDHAKIASANAGKTTGLSAWDKVYDSVIGSIPFMQNKHTKGDKLYDAIMAGDDAYLSRLKSTYKTDDAYQNAVRKALRENDSRIKEAAQAQINGDPSERVRIAKLIIADGFDQDDVVMAINAEINAMTKSESDSDTTKVKGLYKTEDFVREFANGDVTSLDVIRDDILDTEQKNGKTLEAAEDYFASGVRSEAKDAYLGGSLDDATAKKLLVEYAGMDEEDAVSRVDYWSFCKNNPEYADDLAESDVNKYKEFAEPADIPVDVYAQFINGTKGLETKYDKWGDVEVSKRDQVLEVIDSLPLTRQQKYALYWAAGYSKSKIWDVPW